MERQKGEETRRRIDGEMEGQKREEMGKGGDG